jgi:hypothetical protein
MTLIIVGIVGAIAFIGFLFTKPPKGKSLKKETKDEIKTKYPKQKNIF